MSSSAPVVGAPTTEARDMLWTIIAILLMLWLVGLIAGTAGGLIHILLVIALIVLVLNLVGGNRRGGL